MAGLGLYIHIPFCVSKCRYCGFYSEPVGGYDTGSFLEAALAELSLYSNRLAEVSTAYIGGGSPSCLDTGQLTRLAEGITKACPQIEEFTVEFNPGQVSGEVFGDLFSAGVNRVSIGAQSFDQAELRFLGRGHGVGDIYSAVDKARAAGFGNISIDLIFAVPTASMENWQRSLEGAVELAVEHVSAYSLMYEKGSEFFELAESGQIVKVDEETDRVMYETAIDYLCAAGLEQYEISNFARDGFRCLHNLNYWANGEYVGIGAGAWSYLEGRRYMNAADINRYVAGIEAGEEVVVENEQLGDIDRACETAVLNLRRAEGIGLVEFKKRCGFDATEIFKGPIDRYVGAGLMAVEGGRLFLTRAAYPVADSVLCDFSAV